MGHFGQRCCKDYTSRGTPGTSTNCSSNCRPTFLTFKYYLACAHQQIHISTVQLTSLVPFPLNFVSSERELSPANISPAQRCWQHNPSEIKTNLARVYTPFSHFTILQAPLPLQKSEINNLSQSSFEIVFRRNLVKSNI
jgi:hypothetical protein